jgi:hypothetical protein
MSAAAGVVCPIRRVSSLVVGAGGRGQCGAGVPEFVRPDGRQADRFDRSAEGLAEVGRVQEGAAAVPKTSASGESDTKRFR